MLIHNFIFNKLLWKLEAIKCICWYVYPTQLTIYNNQTQFQRLFLFLNHKYDSLTNP